MNNIKSDVNKLHLECSWKDLSEGMKIYGEATSLDFNTGEWTSVKPEIDFKKCIQCLMCVPVCPDSCIPVIEGMRGQFDYNHCKGCGICVKVCPVNAITMEGVK